MSHASAEIVTKAVINYLSQHDPDSLEPPRLSGETRVIQRPWSTIYFFAVQFSGETRKVVAKIVRFIDQTSAEISWQSENLLNRGRREFDTSSCVYNHFAAQPNPLLRSLHPLAYIPEINATLMEFSAGVRMNEYLTLSWLWSVKRRQQTLLLMEHAGQWLRCLHTMPADSPDTEEWFSPADTFQEMLNNIDRLRQLGITISVDAATTVLSKLAQTSDVARVWNHGDFSSGNFLVFPDGGVLGLDVVMDRFDSPYYDLGRFVGDLKTRRSFILRWGWLPLTGILKQLRNAFLSGYFNGEPHNQLLLALYEGYFIFSEWADTLVYIQAKFTGNKILLSHILCRAIINPAFHRIVRQWANLVVSATPTLKPSA